MHNRNFTCCFTGHRQIVPEHAQALTTVVEGAIRRLIAQGYFIFVAGGAMGFDTLAAEVVLKLKSEFTQLRLIIVAPCADQADSWAAADQRRYERLRQAANDFICLETTYTPTCMRKRNRCLVEMSSACLAYCLRRRSGSAQTVALADAQGLDIIDVVSLIHCAI
ncbi:SLOG family protein [Oscillospiraceae bacterium LTW-04]|nr:SLOG family protein [Oscillospiraceae bacterium MB24-C1]